MAEKNFFKMVSSQDMETDNTTLSDGEIWTISEMGGESVFNNEVKAEMKFGSDVLYATHGSGKLSTNQNIIGDGTKVFSMRLINDSSVSETIGVYIKYKVG